MKKLKAILSIAVMGVLIFSTLGFSVSRHYCMGMLVDESFYQVAERCGMHEDSCENDGQQIRTDCCDDETIAIPGLEVQSISKEQLSVPFVASFIPASPHFKLPATNHEQQILLDPPRSFLPGGRQLLLLVQRFLI